VIRLITRLIFVCSFKEKGLVPEELFDERKLKEMLDFSNPKKSTYYKSHLTKPVLCHLNTRWARTACSGVRTPKDKTLII